VNWHDAAVCRHDALHVVAADHFGWPVRGVVRGRDASGLTHLTPLTNGDLHERATELGCILLAPSLDGLPGTEPDLAKLRGLAAAGVRLDRIHDRTVELLADPGFRRRVRVLEFELYSRQVMSGREIAVLLEN
jgi:hypothetical protein